MASEIKIISQARNGKGTPKSWDYKPGEKHAAEADRLYKIMVDGKEDLPVGTKISRKGNAVVFDFPDGTNFTIDDWCTVSDSRLTDLANGQAYSTNDSAYVSTKDIDSGTCLIWGEAGQSGAVLGDAGAAPVTTAAPPPGGDDHTAAIIIGSILGLGAIAALSHDSGGDDNSDKQAPTAGTPDALNEDFAPVTITAATIKANDNSGAGNVQIVNAVIKSAVGFDFTNDGNDANDDVRILTDGGQPVLALNATGANKFGSVTTTITFQDAAGNKTTQDFVFDVTPVNDAPVNSAPASIEPLSFAQQILTKDIGGLVLAVNDPDEVPGLDNHKVDNVVLVTNEGKLHVSSVAGLTIGGNDTDTLTLTGSQTDINTALDSIQWLLDAPGSTQRNVTIQMTSTDKAGEIDQDTVIIPLTNLNSSSSGGGIALDDVLTGGGSAFSSSSIVLQSNSLSSLIGDPQNSGSA